MIILTIINILFKYSDLLNQYFIFLTNSDSNYYKKFYSARCHDYARHEVNLPKKLFSVASMCQKCFTPWRFGQYKCIVSICKKNMYIQNVEMLILI